VTDKKQLLKEFLKDKEIPLFYQALWLDAVCGESGWDVLLSLDNNGLIRAFMPIFQRSKMGISAIILPKLTPYGGILYFPPKNLEKRLSLYAFKKTCTQDLINQMPKVHYFNVAMHPDFTDCQPFIWSGYGQKIRYTYRIHKGSSLAEIWEAFDAKTRNDILFAQSQVSVNEGQDFELFHQINKISFDSQGVKMIYNGDYLKRIYHLLNMSETQSANLWFASVETVAVAGIFVVSDETYTYYIASGKRENAPRGVISYLIWHAIQESVKRNLGFDFEGSDLKQVEHFFRSFGGVQTPYFQISKASNKLLDLGFRIMGKL